MIAILIFFLVVALLIADALIFFALGFSIDITKVIKELLNKGWTIEPPKEDEKLQSLLEENNGGNNNAWAGSNERVPVLW